MNTDKKVNATENKSVELISLALIKKSNPNYSMQCDDFGHVFFGSNAERVLTNQEYR